MTNVYAERDGNRYMIHAKGHATGFPDICAAVSCLMQTLEGYIYAEDSITDKLVRLREGEASVSFIGGDKAEAAFSMTVIGMQRLEATNGDAVKVRLVEC